MQAPKPEISPVTQGEDHIASKSEGPGDGNGKLKPAERTNSYLWGLRFLQILFALIIVGIAGSNISDWHGLGCSSPKGLVFNFAVGILSLILLLYLLLSTGPYAKIPFYSTLAILAFEILFIILWIVAAAFTSYSCSSLCNACAVPGFQEDIGYGFFVWVNDLTCYCYFENDDTSGYLDFSVKRDHPSMLFKRAGGRPYTGSGSGSGNVGRLAKTAEKGVSKAAKEGLDAAMILLLITSVITLITLRYSKKGTKNVDRNAKNVDQHVENTFKMDNVMPTAE